MDQKRTGRTIRMYGAEQRKLAIDTYIKFDLSAADAVAELGHPTRQSLGAWYKDYLEHGEVRPPKRRREPKFALEMRQAAVDYYLAHGGSLARTMRKMGHPASREYLCDWTGGLAPGQRKRRGPDPKAGPIPPEEKIQAVAELESRNGSAAEVAARHGVSRTAPHIWRGEIMGDNVGDTEKGGVSVGKEFDGLPDDAEALQDMLREAKARPRKVQLELDVRQATLEIVKKDPGADPELPTNAEKAAMAEAPRAEYRPCEALPVAGMAKSSCEYAGNARARGETEERAAARKAVVEAFEASGGTCGYRRITAMVGVGGWTVRGIMRDEGLAARAARKRRRYSSYGGGISEAPPNLLRDEKGRHRFRAGKPNEPWATDVTEFRIPAGKACLSPVVDRFDGMPLSWSASTSPDAEMANSSLIGACRWLSEGGRPRARSDRGCRTAL